MDDLEDKIAGHQTQFDVRMFGNALKARQEPKDDGEECHEDREQDGREDTANDANNDGRKTAKPTKPTVGRAQFRDVR